MAGRGLKHVNDKEIPIYTEDYRCLKMLVAFSAEVGHSVGWITFQSRDKTSVQTRQDFMLAASSAGYSTPVIGRVLGLDPSTVWAGIKVAKSRAANEERRCPQHGQRVNDQEAM